jgi:hypothetical protein
MKPQGEAGTGMQRPDSCGASPSHFPLRKNPNPGFELLHFHYFFFLMD